MDSSVNDEFFVDETRVWRIYNISPGIYDEFIYSLILATAPSLAVISCDGMLVENLASQTVYQNNALAKKETYNITKDLIVD